MKYSDLFIPKRIVDLIIPIPIRFLITPIPSIWNVELALKMDATVRAVYFILFNFCLNWNWIHFLAGILVYFYFGQNSGRFHFLVGIPLDIIFQPEFR